MFGRDVVAADKIENAEETEEREKSRRKFAGKYIKLLIEIKKSG